MDEDWDDGVESTPATSLAGIASEGGRGFSAGRGFKAAEGTYADDGFAADNNAGDSHNFNNGYGVGQQGGRGSRRGGRGGGRAGFRHADNNNGTSNDDAWADADKSNEAWNGGGDFGGRGRGRGGGRGRGRGRGGRNGDDGGYGGSNDDAWGNRDNINSDWNDGDFGSRGRGRGGVRGRGRGRGGRSGDDDGGFGKRDDDDAGHSVKREIYVPPERTTDEELFTSTIASGINFIKLDEIKVNVSGEDVPAPIKSFESSGLRPHLLENVIKSGYQKPTPIQKYAIPIIMSGRDLMGCAQTGSGKTAAFLLPVIHDLLENKDPVIVEGSCCQPKVVIVSPTRELAIQIFEQARKFACDSTVKTVVTYGGTSVAYQKNQVMKGCHILVATPGRLNDFVNQNIISFASVKYFVLDEADRMLDMGFLPNVEKMMDHDSMVATGQRQTLMFSATFPEEIQHLAGRFLHNYVFIAVGVVGSASSDVEQVFHQVKRFEKKAKLVSMLKENSNERTVVFVETKRNADFLATLLSESDISTTSIHGDRLQREREQALCDFKRGICNILVATGVAARGLDIEGIQHVINYDLPNNIDEYVHRIGRTGRVGNRGKATSFFDPENDANLAGSLAKILKQAGQEVPDWLASGDFSSGGRSDNFGGRDIRKDQFKAQSIVTASEEPEEEW